MAPFPSWCLFAEFMFTVAMVFSLEETHVLEMDLPSLAILLLPAPPSADSAGASFPAVVQDCF